MRTHYFSTLTDQQMQNLYTSGIETDFSTGNTSRLGYIKPATKYPLKQISTLLSDSHFVRFKNHESIFEQFDAMLNSHEVKTHGGAILFHPENFIAYPRLIMLYEQLIDTIKKSGLGISRPKLV